MKIYNCQNIAGKPSDILQATPVKKNLSQKQGKFLAKFKLRQIVVISKLYTKIYNF